jgi:uncharacterized metal-binding protein YceD (DUF177 family)
MTPVSEFSRMVDLRQIGPKPIALQADEAERRRLAGRFGIPQIDALAAEVSLEADGAEVAATGRLHARIVQSCAVSGEDFPVAIDEPIALRFVPVSSVTHSEEEIELDDAACDEIEYEGTAFDLGEAVAQTLALAIDPFAEGPNAEAARKAAGLGDAGASGPFAALAALRKDD